MKLSDYYIYYNWTDGQMISHYKNDNLTFYDKNGPPYLRNGRSDRRADFTSGRTIIYLDIFSDS
jgi:hypothetical protein